ncbi:GNAT family N-acetyltransferase [Microbacterium oleivorans]|uniref:GNAT family N-acetyltransferase n=1 Tax=Microbacterium TaxID=33882 RepID=UPI00203B9E9C|nr:GNAT family N-acetyltransferase [Microbacterium oleivorans]MCM3695135.1 GNAT family N-acetyltransferase [Microbacterium oleivorans]
MELSRCMTADAGEVEAFLREVDLTVTGLDEPSVRLWVERDESGRIVGSTGYELSLDGRHALIRSVAVVSSSRARGRGTDLARFALDRAAEEGATTAWLFSRRSGGFWQSLGFAGADLSELARVLAETHQVRTFVATGQITREVAWMRGLGGV